MLLIQDLKNIIFEYANIKRENNKLNNYCNCCKKYKHEGMLCLDLIFYQINLSFVLGHLFESDLHKKTYFQEIISSSQILPEPNDSSRYGFTVDSLSIEKYWLKINSTNNLLNRRIEYLEFLNKNFEFVEERNVNFCFVCKNKESKIKLD